MPMEFFGISSAVLLILFGAIVLIGGKKIPLGGLSKYRLFIALILIGGGLWTGGYIGGEGLALPTMTSTTCDVGQTTPDLYWQGTNAYAQSTIVSASTRVWQNGALSSDTSSPFPSGVGDEVKLFAYDGSGYFNGVYDYTVECKDIQTEQEDMYSISTAPTVTFFNSDGTASTAESIGANEDDQLVSIKITAESNACVGSPESDMNLVMCFDWDTVNTTTGIFDSVKPQGSSTFAVPQGNSSFFEACYETNVKSVCDGQNEEITIEIDSDTTNDPDSYNDINVSIFQPQLVWNTDSGLIEWVVEDDNGLLNATEVYSGALIQIS